MRKSKVTLTRDSIATRLEIVDKIDRYIRRGQYSVQDCKALIEWVNNRRIFLTTDSERLLDSFILTYLFPLQDEEIINPDEVASCLWRYENDEDTAEDSKYVYIYEVLEEWNNNIVDLFYC